MHTGHLETAPASSFGADPNGLLIVLSVFWDNVVSRPLGTSSSGKSPTYIMWRTKEVSQPQIDVASCASVASATMHAPIPRGGRSDRPTFGLLITLMVAGCAGGTRPVPPLPPPRTATGPLRVRVIYPPAQQRNRFIQNGETVRADSSYIMPAVDSVFVFGSVGRAGTGLTVNGQPVAVYPRRLAGVAAPSRRTGGAVPADSLVRS